MSDSQTNSSLTAWRRCKREYELDYRLRLQRDGDEREVLEVGRTWHLGHEIRGNSEKGSFDPFVEMRRVAPTDLWGEKLCRLFAGYEWYWESQPLEIIKAESTFRAQFIGHEMRGQIDAEARLEDGREGIVERKTAGESLDGDYFDRLRLATQPGIYSLAMGVPSFILYDVVRKPTINPKNLVKKDVARMRSEIKSKSMATYFGEQFSEEELNQAMTEGGGKESLLMYGARLTADIGDRPDYYFARREVHRTEADYDSLLKDLTAEMMLIEEAEANDLFPRNPDACKTFGTCKYFPLCSCNIYPNEASCPDGFHVREHRHPELDGETTVPA
ncbi:MAG: hypothetical protein DRJ50_13505 [Actinobacteria bacterium]|nr:MAG: hypothetical protein DRJ50_13505 [Actinomycetota bacterium]